jgi:hypothetical protein
MATDMDANVDVDIATDLDTNMDDEVYDDVAIMTHLFIGQYQK